MAIRQGFVKRRPALVLPDQWTPSQVESFALAYEAAQHGGGKQRLMAISTEPKPAINPFNRYDGGEGPLPRPGMDAYDNDDSTVPAAWHHFVSGLLIGAIIGIGTTLLWVHLIARP